MAEDLDLRVSGIHSNEADNSQGMSFRLLMTILFASSSLFVLKSLPEISILLVDAVFCWFCVTCFKHRWRYLFMLHPFIMLVVSLFYQISFLELGDGEAYFAVYNSFTGASDALSFMQELILDGRYNHLNLGLFPTFFIPEFLYGEPNGLVYYFWQSTYFIILVSICLVFAKKWKVMPDEYLFFVTIFAIISPSFFDLGTALTRHFVTFIGVWMFYISFVSVVRHPRLFQIIWVFIAIALIAVSKIVLIIPIFLFVIYYLLIQKNATNKFLRFFLIGIAFFLGFTFFFFFFDLFRSYQNSISKEGAATFGFLANVPILSFFAKYIFALLSPFPWQNANIHIATIYGGNSLLFFMHVLSSLTGIYFFARIIYYARPLAREFPDLKTPIVFGLIMSLSILGGTTGFHTYLLIYFPFFAPLFSVTSYRISFFVPIIIAIGFEALYTISILSI